MAASSHPTPATVAHRSQKPQDTTKPQAERISGAEAIVRSLENLGTDLVFGLPGGAVLPLYEALYSSTKLRHILVGTNKVPATPQPATRKSPAKSGYASPPLGPVPPT